MNQQERSATQERATGDGPASASTRDQTPEQTQPRTNGDDPNRGDNGFHKTGILPQSTVEQFRARWDEIQRGFVDEPRNAAERADQLVTEAIRTLSGNVRRGAFEVGAAVESRRRGVDKRSPSRAPALSFVFPMAARAVRRGSVAVPSVSSGHV